MPARLEGAVFSLPPLRSARFDGGIITLPRVKLTIGFFSISKEEAQRFPTRFFPDKREQTRANGTTRDRNARKGAVIAMPGGDSKWQRVLRFWQSDPVKESNTDN